MIGRVYQNRSGDDQTGAAGAWVPAWLSAANEVAVDAFLAGRLRWAQIAECNDESLERYEAGPAATVEDIVEADRRAREVAGTVVERATRS